MSDSQVRFHCYLLSSLATGMGPRSVNLELLKIQLGQDKTCWGHLGMWIPSKSGINNGIFRALRRVQLGTHLNSYEVLCSHNGSADFEAE